MLKRRKWTIIIFFFAAITIISIATFMRDDAYRASATVIVDAESPETEKEIIRSRRTAYRVMKNLDLKDTPDFIESKDPLETLLKKVYVELIKGTRIVKINVDDQDPVQACRIANEFAKVYVNSNIALKTQVSSKDPSLSSQVQSNNVRIQDFAYVQKKPIKPRKKLIISLAVVMGLAGGIGLSFFREYMNAMLKDPYEIINLLRIPVLGSVPRIRVDGNFIKRKADIDRIVEKYSASLAAESYRSIRTSLLLLLEHSSSAKSIVVTSSLPAEGKTITAVNLSTMIANSGEKVLLVDSNMRRPRLHTIFNMDNKTGFSQFLTGEKELMDIINTTSIDSLYIITSGRNNYKAGRLLSSNNMKLFLERSGSQFSKIIFDTPPVSLVRDTLILSSACTGVVLIAQSPRTTKEALRRSKELLDKADAKILGVIVNNVSIVTA